VGRGQHSARPDSDNKNSHSPATIAATTAAAFRLVVKRRHIDDRAAAGRPSTITARQRETRGEWRGRQLEQQLRADAEQRDVGREHRADAAHEPARIVGRRERDDQALDQPEIRERPERAGGDRRAGRV
jgi:hypothetical protein